MSAKELLAGDAKTKKYYLCSDGQAFLAKKQATEHADHFKISWKLVEVAEVAETTELAEVAEITE